MKYLKSIFIKSATCYILLSAVGCVSGELEDLIVRDRQGNYYRLEGDKTMSELSYHLIKVDTLNIKPFSPCL